MNQPITLRNHNVLLIALLTAVIFCGTSISQSVFAQQSSNKADESSRKPQATSKRTAQVLSNSGYKKMTEAREAMQLEDFKGALIMLAEIFDGQRFSDYDRAKAYQLAAYAYISTDKYPEAIAVYKKALAINVLDSDSEHEILYGLINLSSATENYDESVRYLELWLAQIDEPGAQALFTAAQVFALTAHYQKAYDYSAKAMLLHQSDLRSSVQQGDTQTIEPKESWYRMHLAILLQVKKYEQGALLLNEMLSYWPATTDYYTQLSSLYLELEQPANALTVLAIAKKNEVLEKPQDISRLAQLYRLQDYPYKGALLLDDLLEKNNDVSDDDWKKLGDAYSQSRQWVKAKTAYLQAATISTAGKHYLMLCQTTYRDSLWDYAIDYCKKAIDKGGLEQSAAQAWQVLAMSQYQNNQLTAALNSFNRCAALDDTQKTCEQWHEHIVKQQERAELEKLKLAQQADSEEARQQKRNARIEEALSF